jgi:putative endonuclease
MAQIPAGADRPGQLSRKQTGDAWEVKARRWLEGKGLRFIAANVRGRGGEIDLIMKDGQTTVFVEVRFRQSSQFGGAAASVTPAKQQNYYRQPSCGLPAIMGALILWIAGSMW